MYTPVPEEKELAPEEDAEALAEEDADVTVVYPDEDPDEEEEDALSRYQTHAPSPFGSAVAL